jgi:hypothetical protein
MAISGQIERGECIEGAQNGAGECCETGWDFDFLGAFGEGEGLGV